MKEQKNYTAADPLALPSPADFRAWLQRSMRATNISAARLSRESGMSQNAVAHFLMAPDRDIRLGNARALEQHLRQAAKANGVELDPVEGAP